MPNSIAPLLTAISERYASHGSQFGDELAQAFADACEEPTQLEPASCEQQEALNVIQNDSTNSILIAYRQVAQWLHWPVKGGGAKNPTLYKNLASVELLGPTGMTLHSELRAGLFMMKPATYYNLHRHAATELYAVVVGTANWVNGEGTHTLQPPGALILHASWEQHSMETLEEPLLAIWGWRGDVGFEKYELLE